MRQGEEVLARALASGELRLVESRRPDGTADWVVWTRSELRGALRRHECPGDHDGGSAMTPMGGVGGDARLATSSGYRRKRGEGPPSRAAPGLPGALLVGPGPRGASWHHWETAHRALAGEEARSVRRPWRRLVLALRRWPWWTATVRLWRGGRGRDERGTHVGARPGRPAPSGDAGTGP